MSVVNLSVHKNTRERKEKRRVKNNLKSDMKFLLSNDIAGYAIVTWNRDWDGEAVWCCDKTMPGDVMPQYVKRVLERCTGVKDAKDAIWGPEDPA
ncbi:MAG: hypothetical protein ACR2RF_25040 [Geminicoccaceae bacterium]